MSFTRQAERYYLSASRIKTAISCPLKGHRQYVQKIPTGDGLAAFRGTMMHAALERTVGASRDADGITLKDLVRAEWIESAPEAWRPLFSDWLKLREEMTGPLAELDVLAANIKADADAGHRKGGGTSPRMTNDYKRRAEKLLAPWADTIESLEAEERQLLTSDASPWEPPRGDYDPNRHSAFALYLTSLEAARDYAAWWDETPDADRPEPLAAEAKFRFPFEEFDLAGAIDRTCIDPRLGAALVVEDYKTGKGYDREERVIQAMVYSEACEFLYGQPADYVRFINLDFGPDHPLYTETFPVARSKWAFELLGMCRYARRVLEGVPAPSFKGCGICSYRELCFAEDGSTPFTSLEAVAAAAMEATTDEQ